MSRITFTSLNHSRNAGMFVISGSNYLEISNRLGKIEGIEGIEHDEINREAVSTYNKVILDSTKVKELYKQIKESKRDVI